MSNSPSKQYTMYHDYHKIEYHVKSLCIAKLNSFYKGWWIFKLVIMTTCSSVNTVFTDTKVVYYDNYIDLNCINDAKLYEWHCHSLHAIFLWTITKPRLKKLKWLLACIFCTSGTCFLIVQPCMHNTRL